MEVMLCNMGKNDAVCPQMANINIMRISEATLHHHHHDHYYPMQSLHQKRWGKLYSLPWGVRVASSQ